MRHFTGAGNRPVVLVSWVDVQEFLRRLNARDGGPVYRLPTEAEWEYAARAGSSTAYSFGNDVQQLDVYAWYEDNAGGTTHPVGQKRPNAWGPYDMHGNAAEWVQDCAWGNVTSEHHHTVTNKFGVQVDADEEDRCGVHGYRGGSWEDDPRRLRSDFRNQDVNGDPFIHIGFRPARAAQ